MLICEEECGDRWRVRGKREGRIKMVAIKMVAVRVQGRWGGWVGGWVSGICEKRGYKRVWWDAGLILIVFFSYV